MKIPTSYMINQAFLWMNGKESKTTKAILEVMSANQEELDISVEVLIAMWNTPELYEVAADALQKYASKQEIEDYLASHKHYMEGDCPKGLRDILLHLFIEEDIKEL